jgi:membrane protein YdbS with pleckstrin-like domain
MAVIYKAADKDKTFRKGAKESTAVKQSFPTAKIQPKVKDRREIYHDIARKTLSSTHGLSVAPRGVKFADKDQDENTLAILRRHPITNTPWLLFSLLLLVLIILAFRSGWLVFLPSALQATVLYACLIIALLVAWSGFLSWYFNVSIISDKRIIDIDFHDLIYREVSDAQLDKIEDVTHNMGGLLGIIFNFGDVYVQTAAVKPQIEFLKVPHPAEVASTLRKLREATDK